MELQQSRGASGCRECNTIAWGFLRFFAFDVLDLDLIWFCGLAEEAPPVVLYRGGAEGCARDFRVITGPFRVKAGRKPGAARNKQGKACAVAVVLVWGARRGFGCLFAAQGGLRFDSFPAAAARR